MNRLSLLLLFVCVVHHTWTVEALRCNGQDNGCCTEDNPCDVGEGDCDGDKECQAGLTCGSDNCPWGDSDDCCMGTKAPTHLRCKGIDNGCCTEDNPCEKGDGDCDGDDQCAGDLTCGSDNCPFGDGDDDCCIGEKVKNKCKVSNGGCSHTCVFVLGAAKCACPKGYALGGDKKTCSDINECAHGNGGCSHTCVNTVGGFTCSCPSGFTLSGRTCSDINECAHGNGGCSHTCVNTAGGFTCSCPIGFTLSGRTCSDINECAHGKGGCSHTCVNTAGGFTCRCPSGYKLGANGRTCESSIPGGLVLGDIFRFRSTNYPGQMFRHRRGQVWLDPVTNDDLYVKDSSFKIVSGLNGNGISFESVNYPGNYLRHRRGKLDLNRYDGRNALFRRDATFTVHNALDGTPGAVSFQSVNYRGQYIRHWRSRLYKSKFVNTALFKHDASWMPVRYQPARIPGGLHIGHVYRFRSTNYPGQMFRHRRGQVWLDPVSNADLYVKDSSFKIVNGLDGKGISFESVNYPGNYLRHRRGKLDLNRYDGRNALFRRDATFTVHNALDGTPGAVSFQSVNYRGQYIRHWRSRLYKSAFKNTALFKHDASWMPVV